MDGVSMCRDAPLSLVDKETNIATTHATPIKIVVAVALDVEVLNVIRLFCVDLRQWAAAINNPSNTSETPMIQGCSLFLRGKFAMDGDFSQMELDGGLAPSIWPDFSGSQQGRQGEVYNGLNSGSNFPGKKIGMMKI
jgi:hypothetical protein